jgi:hypothetical protein
MTFGVSVAAYNKKPNTYIQKVLSPDPTVKAPDVAGSATAQPQQPTKTALGGSTAPVASGFVNNIQSPVYQPLYSGGLGQKNDSIYGRLNAINETTSVRDEETRTKVDIQNRRINAFNNKLSQQAQQLDGDFSGTGDSGLDAEQLDNARAIASIGKQRGMSDQGIQIALMTALTESGLRNLNYGDRDSLGLFQQRPSQGWGSREQVSNREYSAAKFYDSLAKTNWQGTTPWMAAQNVQRSFDPTGSNYQKQYALAQRAFNAIYNPGAAAVGGSNSASGWIQAYNNKYVDYDGAFGAQCVDLYNYYTAGFVGGKNIMVGYAPEIFNAYDRSAYTRYGGNIPGRMGDVAVFRPGGGTPVGHVAIVVGDNGNGTLRVLHANATPAGHRGNTIISNISKASLMGYLRPNKLGA